MKTLSDIEKAVENLSSDQRQELIEFYENLKVRLAAISLQPNARRIWNAGR
jgi:hypothetical protein